ncbi:MAG: hypothetical protein AAGC60_16270 [Acidobacteriota bacterium]
MTTDPSRSTTAARAPTGPPLQVKGGSIRSKLDFVRAEFGDDAAALLEKELDERGIHSILEATWYDYELFDWVLREIARLHYGGSLERLREVGRFSARQALTTTYDFFVARADLDGFLTHLSKLHGRFYSRGALSLVEREATSLRLLLHGAGFYREPDLQVAAGFFEGAAAMLGCRDPHCSFVLGGDRVELLMRWS